MPRINELDGLRAVAIVAVLACHFARQYNDSFTFLRLGWTGVDLFFAISGFLITGILVSLRGRTHPYRTFYWRRSLRIFPPYYLAFLLVIGLAVLHDERLSFHEIMRHGLFLSSLKLSLVKSAFVRLFSSGPLQHTAAPTIASVDYIPQFRSGLPVYWSLSVEELFYLLWAPIVLMSSRRTIALFSTLPLIFCPILRGLAHTPSFDEAYGFVFRLDSLAAGGVVALLFEASKSNRLNVRRLRNTLVTTTVLSSFCLALLGWHCGKSQTFDVRSTFAFALFGYSFLLTLCSSLVGICAHWSGSPFILFRLLRARALVYLGTISYVIYLIHMPVYAFLQLSLLHYLGVQSARVLDMNNHLLVLLGILSTICTVSVASVVRQYIELPIMKLKDQQFPVASENGVTPKLANAVNV